MIELEVEVVELNGKPVRDPVDVGKEVVLKVEEFE